MAGRIARPPPRLARVARPAAVREHDGSAEDETAQQVPSPGLSRGSDRATHTPHARRYATPCAARLHGHPRQQALGHALHRRYERIDLPRRTVLRRFFPRPLALRFPAAPSDTAPLALLHLGHVLRRALRTMRPPFAHLGSPDQCIIVRMRADPEPLEAIVAFDGDCAVPAAKRTDHKSPRMHLKCTEGCFGSLFSRAKFLFATARTSAGRVSNSGWNFGSLMWRMPGPLKTLRRGPP